MGFGLDETEKLLRILVLFIILMIVIIIAVKLNQTWGFLTTIKNVILCWAFGTHC